MWRGGRKRGKMQRKWAEFVVDVTISAEICHSLGRKLSALSTMPVDNAEECGGKTWKVNGENLWKSGKAGGDGKESAGFGD